MVNELGTQQNNSKEIPDMGMHFVILKNWDKTIEALQKFKVGDMATTMGFDLHTLAVTISKEFAVDLPSHPEYNTEGEKIEDVIVETISVNGRPLDRLLVTAYPPAANPNFIEMTKFKYGGEVIFITDGEAEITYALRQTGENILKSDLTREKMSTGDLIISTDTPNNWTQVFGDKFSFIYFVGNPNGPQKYGEIPKVKIPVKLSI